MTLHSNSKLTRTALREGESLYTCVRAGAQIVVSQGEVVLTEPATWAGETMVAPRTRLVEGSAHCIGQAGWIDITAHAPTEVLQWSTPSSWEVATDALRGRAARLLLQLGQRLQPKAEAI